jgi:GNAT superfamily N-acetyltransferase
VSPQIRPAAPEDTADLFVLAHALATSFEPRRNAFEKSFAALLKTDSARILVATDHSGLCGYLLGFTHQTFYANGPVAWVEEVMVEPRARRTGIGAGMMAEFERWAADRGAALVALATRRAAPFYEALQYEESATYSRKLL